MTTLKKLAEDAKLISELSGEDAYLSLIDGIGNIESDLQKMIDALVAIQDEWPMPEEGWHQFVEDVQRTNEKYGFNLQIKSPGS